MKYLPINPNLFVKNRKKIVQSLLPKSVAIVLSNDEMPRSGDGDFVFRQSSELFYLSGMDQEKTILILCPDHPTERFREILFIRHASKELEIWQGHKYTKQEATETSGIKTIMWEDQFEKVFNDMVLANENIYLNLNENVRFSSEVPYREMRFVEHIKGLFPLHKYHRLAPAITASRLVKEPEEIELIKNAIEITKQAYHRILKFIKPGVMEYEIEAEITHEFLMRRASGHAYPPIIASGAGACVLHYVNNNQECISGDLILIDFGAEYANYNADCTRVIPVNGNFTNRQREVYNATLRVMEYAKSLLIPGITINEYHKKVCKRMEKELIQLGLITQQQVDLESDDMPLEQKAFFRYYMHGTSHFLGLDVHDVGSKNDVLQEGMVVTCEPGIYIAEENIGIRLETNIVVGNPPLDLMADFPILPEDIEEIMHS